MKIKLDENLPSRLKPVLQRYGHDVDTVPEEHLNGRPDTEIWHAVSTEGRFLITQDLDFSDTRQFAPGTHAGLLLVRLREPGAHALLEAISTVAAESLIAPIGAAVLSSSRNTRYGSSALEDSLPL